VQEAKKHERRSIELRCPCWEESGLANRWKISGKASPPPMTQIMSLEIFWKCDPEPPKVLKRPEQWDFDLLVVEVQRDYDDRANRADESGRRKSK